ncbi:MAG: transporter substrate-binding domain-containing protein [Desulfobacula sp.]|nr:transporter substrate-binding domain-containing protein [Desulfobacula sp.]
MKKRNWTTIVFLAMVYMALGYPFPALGQRTGHGSEDSSMGAALAGPAKIIVADDSSYAPFSFMDAQGQPAGITVDIWTLWSRKTGIAVDFSLMEWNAALAAVREGRADAVGGLFRTTGREAFFDFSQPFFTVETTIFFHKQILGIRGLADLQGFTIGVVKDDSAEELIRQKYPTALPATFPSTEDMVRAAVDGKIRVFVADTAVGLFYLAKLDQADMFRHTATPIAANRQHTAVAKGNAALLTTVQQGFDRIDEKEIQAIVQSWTGRTHALSLPWGIIGFCTAGVASVVGLVIAWNIMLKRRITFSLAAVEERNRQLKDSEARFRALFDLAPFACVVSDFKGRYRMVNQNFCKLLNLKEQNVIGHTLEELGFSLTGTDTGAVKDELIRLGSVSNKEVTVLTPEKEPRTSLYSGKIIELEGEKVVLTATVDITPLRQAEQQRRESEYRFRAFFNSNPEGIVLMSLDGKILDISKTFTKMSGYNASAVKGRHFNELVPDVHHQKALHTFSAIKSGLSQEKSLETALICRDGRELPISVKGWRAADEKSAPVMIGVFIRDLTREKNLALENKNLQKQLIHTQKLDAIGTLAGGIAHDFNNILAGMIGYTELCLKDEAPAPDNKRYAYLTRVLEAGHRAKDLVRQILTFSRKEETVMGVVAMTPLIKESIKLLRATLPATIQIDQNISARPDTTSGDPTQIHQVVMNLCTNAYHAMREKGGILTISLENIRLESGRKSLSMEIPPGDYLKLGIRDTGSGIPPQVLDRIFEPYFTTKKMNEGTGLGLSVTLGIVRSHNGLIELDSRVNEGTRFDIYFPLANQAEAKSPARAGSLPKGEGQRLLIVDDEFFFMDVVRETLGHLGYQVVACQSSLKALETFRQAPGKVDLIITDQTMPEMTGVQLIAEIRKTGSMLPILLCTGYSDTVTEQSARHYGINQFLMKPVTTDDLAWAVHDALHGRKEKSILPEPMEHPAEET